MMARYLFTLEVDVTDGTRLIEYARRAAQADGLSEADAVETIADAATAVQWLFDDHEQLLLAGEPASIIGSACVEMWR